MAGIWGLSLHVTLLLISVSSIDAIEDTNDLQFGFDRQPENDVNIVSEGKSELDPHFFQGHSQQPPPYGSKWDDVQQDIRNVLEELPQGRSTKPDSDVSYVEPSQMNRGQALKDLYNRLVIASVDKRSLYGNVLNGYKLGKREFMPYELMNEYQKRLFGSVLNNYKFGKRVPEELPANYLTGGQIYDNISDDPQERKRMYGSILRSYKLGKRIPPMYYHGRGLRNPMLPFPNYRILQQSLYKDS